MAILGHSKFFLVFNQIQELTPKPMDRGVLFLAVALLFTAILAHRFWRENSRLKADMSATQKDQNFYYGSYRKAWSRLNTASCLVDRTSGVVIKATSAWIEKGLPPEGQKLATLDTSFDSCLKALKPLENGTVPESLDIMIQGSPYKMEGLEEEALGIVLVQPKH